MQIKAGDKVSFSVNGVFRVGVVLERVRAKRLPCTHCCATRNLKSRPSSSLVIAVKSARFWIDESECAFLGSQTDKQNVSRADLTGVLRKKNIQPEPFRHDFSALLKYLKKNNLKNK